MKLAGTSETGWVPIDLTDVAAAIATVRATTSAEQLRDHPVVPAQRERARSAVAER